MSKHGHDYALGLYDKDGKWNQKRADELVSKNKNTMHTNLTTEIEGTYTTKDWWIDLAITTIITIITIGVAIMFVDMLTGYQLHYLLAEVIG